jgi:hypothetical protein
MKMAERFPRHSGSQLHVTRPHVPAESIVHICTLRLLCLPRANYTDSTSHDAVTKYFPNCQRHVPQQTASHSPNNSKITTKQLNRFHVPL